MKTISLIIILFTTFILTANVYAHTGLESSVPIDNAMLMESPKAIELNFTEEVHLTKFEVTSKMSGNPVEVDFTPSVTASSNFSLPVPALPMGSYQVNWALLGGDGHQIEGFFGFMVHGEGSMPMMNHGQGDMPMMDHSGMATESETESSKDHESHNGH